MSDPVDADAFRVFRPRRGRFVAMGAAAGIVVVFSVAALFMPGPQDGGIWTPGDRAMMVALSLAIAAFLLRYAMIQAVPTREGLRIRNLLLSRTLTWAEIVRVSFSGGDPWVRLDLADTDQVAVMAIQKADGEQGRVEARRLAALVAALSAPDDTEP